MARILIKNGRVWDGEKFFSADILTCDGKIAEISEAITSDAEFVYDASGKIVSAGLVDAHLHLRGVSPGFGAFPEVSCMPFGVTAAADAAAAYGTRSYLDSLFLKNVVFVACRIEDNHAYFDHTEKMLTEYGERAIGVKLFFDTLSKETVFIGASVFVLLICSLFDCHFFNIGPTLFYAMALAFAENCNRKQKITGVV